MRMGARDGYRRSPPTRPVPIRDRRDAGSRRTRSPCARAETARLRGGVALRAGVRLVGECQASVFVIQLVGKGSNRDRNAGRGLHNASSRRHGCIRVRLTARSASPEPWKRSRHNRPKPGLCQLVPLCCVRDNNVLLQSVSSGEDRFASSVIERISRTTSAISLALRRSRRISYGVNIRGAGEYPTMRLSSAVDGVIECLPAFARDVESVSSSDALHFLPFDNLL